jgi:hypothetical protein
MSGTAIMRFWTCKLAHASAAELPEDLEAGYGPADHENRRACECSQRHVELTYGCKMRGWRESATEETDCPLPVTHG